MSLTSLLSGIRLSSRDAEVIFDRDEPVGEATDLVLPGRRWFRRDRAPMLVKAGKVDQTASQPNRSGLDASTLP